MSGFVCSIKHLLDLGSGHVAGKNPANALSVKMNLEHDLRGSFAVLGEKLLQDHHHDALKRELHA